MIVYSDRLGEGSLEKDCCRSVETVLAEDIIRVESEGSNEDLPIRQSVTQQRTKTKYNR